MAWDTRGGRRYYYRSRREGGRVVRQYVGADLLGELEAREDDRRRIERERACHELEQERERLAAADAPLAELDALADALVAGALLLAGYHQHDRGAWRKGRKRHDDA
jgi:hypothetical protein